MKAIDQLRELFKDDQQMLEFINLAYMSGVNDGMLTGIKQAQEIISK